MGNACAAPPQGAEEYDDFEDVNFGPRGPRDSWLDKHDHAAARQEPPAAITPIPTPAGASHTEIEASLDADVKRIKTAYGHEDDDDLGPEDCEHGQGFRQPGDYAGPQG